MLTPTKVFVSGEYTGRLVVMEFNELKMNYGGILFVILTWSRLDVTNYQISKDFESTVRSQGIGLFKIQFRFTDLEVLRTQRSRDDIRGLLPTSDCHNKRPIADTVGMHGQVKICILQYLKLAVCRCDIISRE